MKTEEPTYTIAEIALATGISAKTLQSRRRARGIPAGGGGVYVGAGEADGEAAAQETRLRSPESGTPESPAEK